MSNKELIAEARGIGNWALHETGPEGEGRTGPTLFARLVYALEAAESPTTIEAHRGRGNRGRVGEAVSAARDELQALAAESLRDVAYTCGRVWEAWSYGTMTYEDFAPAWESDELTGSIADEIVKAGFVRQPTAADSKELWEALEWFDDAGASLSIQDAGQRAWIIVCDEEGDHWANSFEHEDDDRPMPCRLTYAPIKYPVRIFAPEPAS
jgi:hypothetical protein